MVFGLLWPRKNARLPVVENHEIQDASEPMPPPIHEASEASPSPIHEASVPRPSSPINEAFNSIAAPSPFKGSRNEQTDDDGNGKLNPESTQPGPLAGIGLIPIIPGGDGSFHFALGPIDFGGNIGFGGSAPGYAVPYNQPQPYVVVSPYTSPYATSSPNQPFVTGSRQSSPGYYGPASGYGQPSQGYSGPYSSAQGNTPPVQYGQPSNGYYSPYASARGNAPSSAQIGSSFFNRYN